MNVGIRYREGRTGRPREIGVRHVRNEEEGGREGAPRAYGRLTRHERGTVQRMLERGASRRQIARKLGGSPSTVSSEVASHRFVLALL